MKVERIDQIDIDVKNLDEAEKLFSELFETTFERIKVVGKSTRVLTEHADKAFEEAQLKVAMSPIGLSLIETVPPLEKEGLRALDLKVSDLEQAKAEMKGKGIRKLADVTMGDFKQAIYPPEDCHGVRLCLREYKAPNALSAIRGK
jgi:hypothetical protein